MPELHQGKLPKLTIYIMLLQREAYELKSTNEIIYRFYFQENDIIFTDK